MKQLNRLECTILPIALMAVLVGNPDLCRCQTKGHVEVAPQTEALSESLRDLQARIQELKSILGAMRAEAAQSGDEIRTLHNEVQQTREELASMKGQITKLTSQQTSTAESGPYPIPKGPLSRPDATDQRLAKLEEDQQLLGAKVDEQYQTKVESESKYRVKLSGIALLNVFGNRGSVDSIDLPSFAVRRGPLDTGGSFGATVRQTMLGLEVIGPTLGGARTSAEIQADFFGGFPATGDGVTTGLARLRTVTARMDWSHTSIVAGQDALFFSPQSPTSFASLALPAFSYSGNLWKWTPQLRIEHSLKFTDVSSLMVQAGILDPLAGEYPSDSFQRSPGAGERARQPAYATRFSWNHGTNEHAVTLGAGAYYSRQDWGFGRTLDAWAGTADWNLPLSSRLYLTGEFYRGRALGGLGGGSGRSILTSGSLTDPGTSVLGLNSTGGWSQLKFEMTEKLELNGAFGEDDPSAADLRRFSVRQGANYVLQTRNQTAFLNFVYRPFSNWIFSTEYRRLWTSETDHDKSRADQVNVGVGVLF